MQELNIVELIESNPITKLSQVYNGKLLNKIQENFTGFEQQLFVSSFFCYLNYDKTMDFVVDLDNVWKWLGFTLKENAKRTLEKHFKIDVDYKIIAPSVDGSLLNQEKPKQNGGQNKQTIILTIRCFKSLCLKAQTKKATEIHEYYMKMEEVLQEIVEEETDELRIQLEQKDNIILEKDNALTSTKKEKQRAVEQATIAQFPLNTECIYFGTIDNTNEAGEKLIKFGHTNDLSTRVQDHHKKYNNFILVAAFRVQNKVEIENLIKTYPKIKRQIRSIEVNGKNKTEIIAYDSTNFTIDRLSKHIKDIIHAKTYSIDNYNRLLKEVEDLKNINKDLENENKEFKEKNAKQQLKINELTETIEKQAATIESAKKENESVFQNVVYHNDLLPDDEQTNSFNEFIDKMCIVHTNVEVSSTEMEGQYRIWCKTKPKKETFHAFKSYLDTRFKASRLSTQTKNQVVNGYIGVQLKEIVYKKSSPIENDAETFVFQVCKFSPSGKILNSTLLEEYKRWKQSVNKTAGDNDMKELKEYLNSCEYVLKAVVWTDKGSNEGYYGLSLKTDEYKHKLTSTTGKRVEKRELVTNILLGSWETIAKAAVAENMCASKMSKSIKNKAVYDNYHYLCA